MTDSETGPATPESGSLTADPIVEAPQDMDAEASGLRRRNVTTEREADDTPTADGQTEGAAVEPASPRPPLGPGEAWGRTPDGEVFRVPVTTDVMARWKDYKHYSISEYIRLFLIVVPVFLALFTSTPPWIFAAMFLFWRLAYDLGLGVLLHYQSKSGAFVRWFNGLKRFSLTYAVLRRMVVGSMGNKDFDFESYPDVYRSWLVFRQLVDIILNLDVVCYFLMVIKYTEVPVEFHFVDLSYYIFGFILVVFSYWAKSDALRVIKDFAWYWGDFFFLLTDQELVFNGVFEMFPHPMYSVGYSFFYGASLISRSYTVLYVSLFAHFCQLLFLARAENPHIERTYGSMVKEQDPTKSEILYSADSGYFRRDLIVFHNLDPFRSSDLFMLLLIGQMAMMACLNLPTWYYIGQAILWRAVLTFGMGYILHKQSLHNWWNEHFIKLGYTKAFAFDNWKSMYNLCLTMTYTSFIICAVKLFSGADWNYGPLLVRQTVGILLLLINIWSSTSTYEVIGDFGWFYGDFFIKEYKPLMYYTGIYRYFNNPESVTGFAGFYGLALIADSYTMLTIALLSQASNALFVTLVEKPHMLRLYGEKIRADGGILANVKTNLKKVAQTPIGQKIITHPIAQNVKTQFTEATEKTKKIVQTNVEKVGRVVDKMQENTREVVEKVKEEVTRTVERLTPQKREAQVLEEKDD